MAKKGTKIQVVDLGTHFVKAALCEAGDGPVTISKSAAVPLMGVATDADAYLGELQAAFDGLLDFLDKKIPVYFVAPESLIHVGVSYLNNLAPDQVDSAIEADRQKFVSAQGSGQYDQSINRSFKLREKPQNKNKQVVLANAYTKMEHMDAIYDLCSSKKLTWGGLFPRLFALNELYRMSYGAGGDGGAVGCMVDVGFKSTSILAFKDANVVFHKVLHLGAYQLYQELYNIDAKLQLDLFSLVAIMANHGFNESEDTLTALGLPLPDPSKYLEVLQSERDQLFTKVQLSIDYFSTVAATDFNTSMSTVMAVRKGPERIVFSGGLSASPGFGEAAGQYFQAGEILDPGRALTMSSASLKTDLPPNFFVMCAAGAQLAASGAPEYNLGDRYKGGRKGGSTGTSAAAGGGGGGGGGGQEPFAPTWAVLLAFVGMCGLGYHGYDLNTKVKRLQSQVGAATTEVDKAHDLINDFKKLRVEEGQARLRLEFAESLVKPRIDWTKFFTDLAEATPDGTKVFLVQINTTLPNASEAPADTADPTKDIQAKVVTFKFCGEALRRENVAQFVQNLEKSKRFVKIGAPDIVQVSEGQNMGPCTDPEASGVDFQKHFAFTVSGNIAY